jgi:nucleoside-diphosphate-sugar epimerase
MHFFVTGATGFIGGHVVSQLLADGHRVTALVRTIEQARDIAGYGVEPHLGDIGDKESMRRGMRGVDGVFHLAAFCKVGTRHRNLAETVNVGGTRNVLGLMRDLGIPKGVYTSTLAVNGDTRGRLLDESYSGEVRPMSAYDRSKWQAHHQVALPLIQAGLPLVVVMPGLVYGPGPSGDPGHVFRRYLRGRLPAIPDGVRVSWAHVADVARGHLLAMERGRPGESYMICGEAATMREALTAVGRMCGRRPPAVIPAWVVRSLSAAVGGGSRVLPLLRAPAEILAIAGGVSYLGDDSKARREIGFDPRPLEEGLQDLVVALLEGRLKA